MTEVRGRNLEKSDQITVEALGLAFAPTLAPALHLSLLLLHGLAESTKQQRKLVGRSHDAVLPFPFVPDIISSPRLSGSKATVRQALEWRSGRRGKRYKRPSSNGTYSKLW